MCGSEKRKVNGLAAFGMCVVFLLLSSFAQAGTKQPAPQAKPKQGWRWNLVLAPQMGFPAPGDVPFGAGAALQVVLNPIKRFGFGLEASWSQHGGASFTRAALLLHVLIDDLIIHPFLQTGVGLQLRWQGGQVFFTPDVHLGVGFDVPLPDLPWFTIGASLQLFFPIDVAVFPISQTLHLRCRLLF